VSRRRPQYRLVTDAAASHLGIALRSPAATFGSSRPYVAAVLVARRYAVAPSRCDCASTCACPKVERWVVERTSYTRLAADVHCDTVRRHGARACVVPMRPVDPGDRGPRVDSAGDRRVRPVVGWRP